MMDTLLGFGIYDYITQRHGFFFVLLYHVLLLLLYATNLNDSEFLNATEISGDNKHTHKHGHTRDLNVDDQLSLRS